MVSLNAFNLTTRDRSIVETLTLRVRVLSVRQIARHWFAGQANATESALRRLSRIEAAGLIEQFSAFARPEPIMEGPVIRWSPGCEIPNFEAVSYRLVSRWDEPAVLTKICIATMVGGSLAGGYGGRRPRPSEVSHDICLTAIYLRRIVSDPTTSAKWLSEARLRSLGFGDHTRLPDAIIEEHGVRTVIEFGGSYSGAKLRDFHDFCVEEALAYEIW
jgi:hypothetical protein